jgi:hopene-associated glycosyltransferase HpnB
MSGTLAPLALAALAAWLVLLFQRGGFWRADQRLPAKPALIDKWPEIVAVIPARNEADYIGRAVTSLLTQDYPAALKIVVVDDRSDDGTAEKARAAAAALGAESRLTVILGTPLPAGWAGKMWAVEQGVNQAKQLSEAPYMLLTDADIEHEPRNLRQLVAHAESEKLDLVSLMVRLHCRSAWERLLIPAFVFFFQMLYPFPLVNQPQSRVAAAAGGCMLVRRQAFDRAGGIEAIRSAIIDDCALALKIKAPAANGARGGAIWLGLSEETRSIRPYGGLGEIWGMVARSAYTQLNHSPRLLVHAMTVLTLTFIGPPAILIIAVLVGAPVAGVVAGIAWALMAYCYRPTLALYRERAVFAPLLPVAALLYFAMTIDSARLHWRGRGAGWKGRTYQDGQRRSA